jgi:hypothetical protein
MGSTITTFDLVTAIASEPSGAQMFAERIVTIAVVGCDKPPVGTLAALLEHNLPSIIMSDGPIHPGIDPKTGQASARPRQASMNGPVGGLTAGHQTTDGVPPAGQRGAARRVTMQSSFGEDHQHAAGRARRHDQTVANLHTGRANCLGRSGEIVDRDDEPCATMLR